MQEEMGSSKANMHEHWLSRDYETSARLHLQHWLFQTTLGHIIDRTIVADLSKSQASGTPLRVADIACGNAAWLFELACDVSTGTEMDMYGFDIQPAHFPTASSAPPNVHLLQQDVFKGEFPEEFIGSFDLVHARAFSSMIKDNNVEPLCQVAMKLLKPGGYLQWEEADQSNLTASIDGKPAPQGSKLIHLLRASGAHAGITWDWHAVMGQKVEACGFRDVAFQMYLLKPHQSKAWTEDYLLAYKDLGEMIPSEKDIPGSTVTRESYNALFASVTEEARRGMILHTGHVSTIVARK